MDENINVDSDIHLWDSKPQLGEDWSKYTCRCSMLLSSFILVEVLLSLSDSEIVEKLGLIMCNFGLIYVIHWIDNWEAKLTLFSWVIAWILNDLSLWSHLLFVETKPLWKLNTQNKQQIRCNNSSKSMFSQNNVFMACYQLEEDMITPLLLACFCNYFE